MPPEQPITELPKAELAVLLALWDQGTSTIRQLADLLYPGGKAAQYGTVQKLLERLEQKECVERDRSTWPHRFTAAVNRETLIGWRLRDTAEKLCGGSTTPLLLHLLRAEAFTPQERQELQAFLEQLLDEPRAEDN